MLVGQAQDTFDIEFQSYALEEKSRRNVDKIKEKIFGRAPTHAQVPKIATAFLELYNAAKSSPLNSADGLDAMAMVLLTRDADEQYQRTRKYTAACAMLNFLINKADKMKGLPLKNEYDKLLSRLKSSGVDGLVPKHMIMEAESLISTK